MSNHTDSKNDKNVKTPESSGEYEDNSTINKNNTDIHNLKAHIENSKKLQEALTGDNAANLDLSNISINDNIVKTAATLRNLNSIKEDLCILPLDPCEKNYFINSVQPLLQTLDQLSRASFDLSTSVTILTSSPIISRKKSKLKNSIDLIYDMNEQCEDVYCTLKKRIDILLNCK